VDEVNLLEDHIVDLLLDSAAMGVNTVEREGISFSHPARFILVGTMNPEEGDLRPQLLDRFGLCVQVTSVREPELRVEILRRKAAFDDDPAAATKGWAGEQAALSRDIVQAQSALRSVPPDDETLARIVRITAALDLDGHRAGWSPRGPPDRPTENPSAAKPPRKARIANRQSSYGSGHRQD
jgi:magnesium chelatase subunit I